MAAGQAGVLGASVPKRVGTVTSTADGTVTIPPRGMEERIVLVLTRKQEDAL